MKARKWSRLCITCLFGFCMTAIYQERALSPALHDQMHVAADIAVEFVYESENGSSVLSGFGSFGGGAGQSQYDPITTALLKLRR